MRVAGLLAVAHPMRDGRPPVTIEVRRAAVAEFRGPVELFAGHNETHHLAPVIGSVDALYLDDDGWTFTGYLTHPIAISNLIRAGELPLSAEYHDPVVRPASSIYWPRPTPHRGVLVGVAVLRADELPACPGSRLWIVR